MEPPPEPPAAGFAPPPAPAPAPAPAPVQPFQPGFFDALGRWIGDSKAKLDEQLKSTQETLGGFSKGASGAARDAVGAAAQATDALVNLPGSRVVIGRERCAVAANGAPDCTAAANALCRTKGYGSGRGVDINSAQKCPAWVWWSGRAPSKAECTTETFVLRAMCQ